jgi:hypothetical protein
MTRFTIQIHRLDVLCALSDRLLGLAPISPQSRGDLRFGGFDVGPFSDR